jgi:hypothetical protein
LQFRLCDCPDEQGLQSDQPAPGRICHDNRDGRIEALRGADAGGSVRHDYSHIFLSQLVRKFRKALIVATREVVFKDLVAAFH